MSNSLPRGSHPATVSTLARVAGRIVLPVVIATMLWAVASSAGWAQAAADTKKAGKVAIEERTLTTKDGVDLAISYLPSKQGREAPVAVLLHGKGKDTRKKYLFPLEKSFAAKLNKQGFAVIAVDLRGHGESPLTEGSGKKSDTTSLKPADYARMVEGDLEAVKKFIFDEHQREQLNMNRIGIVAAESSAAVAIAYADLDWQKLPYDDAPTARQRTPRGQDVRALVLLSPEEKVAQFNLPASIKRLRSAGHSTPDFAALLVYGTKDPSERNQTKRMFDLFLGGQKPPKDSGKGKGKDAKDEPSKDGDKPKDRFYLGDFEVTNRGTDLLDPSSNLGVDEVCLEFLRLHVAEAKSEWRDRRSALERD